MINLDQIYARTPYDTFVGTEIFMLQKAGVTGGALLSTLKSFFKSDLATNDVTDATTLGKQLMTVTDLPAAKTLLEIPTPAAPVTLSADTTLGAAHINRRVFVNTSPVTLTLNVANLTDSDSITIVNTATAPITINAGVAEDIIVEGSATPVATYSLGAASVLKAYLVDVDTWFFEV